MKKMITFDTKEMTKLIRSKNHKSKADNFAMFAEWEGVSIETVEKYFETGKMSQRLYDNIMNWSERRNKRTLQVYTGEPKPKQVTFEELSREAMFDELWRELGRKLKEVLL